MMDSEAGGDGGPAAAQTAAWTLLGIIIGDWDADAATGSSPTVRVIFYMKDCCSCMCRLIIAACGTSYGISHPATECSILQRLKAEKVLAPVTRLWMRVNIAWPKPAVDNCKFKAEERSIFSVW
ncbi:hypothetical protein EJB05_09883 [Eragrostis curvula]|uniref:Uncharacterized protein n=1 Tax=Eragrostis curvula TaxID=38414 RepID=A0A5J9W623_9POAL|nr:hypothetical protein EJB05_09883 [Eragrostis curvula]